MKGKKEEDRLIEEFAAARIAVWEVKHGLLSTQGRECINTIITCSIKGYCIRIDPTINSKMPPWDLKIGGLM
jgi:hypothetical protein